MERQVNLIFISSRQVTLLDFDQYPLKGASLNLVLSDAELTLLDDNIVNEFSNVLTVPVLKDDGVLYAYDVEGTIKAVSTLILPESINAIVCFDEGNVMTAAYAREAFGVNGSRPDVVSNFRNKVRMKEILNAEGVKLPRFMALDQSEDVGYNDLKEQLGLPFVIKPVESAGSNGINIISNNEDYRRFVKKIREVSLGYEAESYIQGRLYHCDITFCNSEIIYCQCTEYLESTIQFQEGVPLGGRVMQTSESLWSRLMDFTRRSLNALGATNGSFHTEVFVNDQGELVFLESGARPPGMLVTKMYKVATGVNILNLDVAVQLDHQLEEVKSEPCKYSFYLMYPKRVGVVMDTNNCIDFQNDSVSIEYSCYSNAGEIHEGCYSNLDFCASVIGSGKDKASFNDLYAKMAVFEPLVYDNTYVLGSASSDMK